jgi:8-hydroxy-5-deazaflavin:NADPH oxidoreductase
MTYSIIGSGAIGSVIASQFARKGVDVFIANTRGPESLADLVKRLGSDIKAVTVEEAIQADIIILAIHFDEIPAVASQITAKEGRIVVDCSNAIDLPAFTPTDLGGRPSSEVVAENLPGVHVVKAFNTLPAAILSADPTQNGGRRVIFVSGNETKANDVVASLIEQLGFAPIILGKVAEGGRLQQFGGPLASQNLVKHG